MTRLMYDDRLRIRVCGGMNCAPAGGRKVEEAFIAAIENANLTDRVEVLRAHCLGECADGPCVRIGGDRFYHVDASDVPQLLRDEVLPRL